MKKHLMISALLVSLLWGCTYNDALSTTAAPTQTTAAQTTAATTHPTTTAPDPIALLLESMSTEEKVGQLFFARCPEEGALEDISKYHLGGFVLFGRDFEYETPETARAKIQAYQAVSKIPLLIAVDEEGGDVTRVSCYQTFRDSRFLSPRNLYDQGSMELIRSTEREKCQLLSSLGINVNLAPVCDIATGRNAFMYRRSLGQDAQTTGEFVTAVTAIMTEHRIGSVLKHFPGYGNNADTHTGIAVDTRPLAELEQADLLPFTAGIRAGCGAIMMSHIIVSSMDESLPASLSPAVHNYLRQDMGFDGVVVTDDLVMDAISDQYGDGEAAVLAVLAGNDLLCSSKYPEQYAAVLDAVNNGRISIALLDGAVYRVLRWKFELGVIATS